MTPSGALFDGLHTKDYFGMIPKSKITFAPPPPKTAAVDIPFADGIIDETELLTDKVAYGNRQGSLEFVVLHEVTDYAIAYSKCMMALHGQFVRIVLDDDPLFYYQGRLSVNSWKSYEGASTIVIDYDLDPYKYSLGSTDDYDWLWNDLFDNVIYYGIFDVKGTKARTFINPSSSSVVPEFVCSASMEVTMDGFKYRVPKGRSKNHGILLKSGDNHLVFKGTGRVKVDYSVGKQL